MTASLPHPVQSSLHTNARIIPPEIQKDRPVNRVVGIAGLLVLVIAVTWATPLAAQYYARPVETAPQPDDIGGEYVLPEVQRPQARAEWLHIVDVAVMAAMLGLVAWVVLRRRSRKLTVVAVIVSLLYFGFYREGCVCPIGAIQNVAVALTDPHYAIPYTLIVIFFLPLVMALIFGRVFCGGVCALGAIQDLVLLKPLHLPRRLDKTLGLFKYVYLGLAIWFAVQPGVPGGTLTFEPGTTAQTITVPVVGDNDAEPDETFFVRLFGPTNAALGNDRAQCTITNDDGDVNASDTADASDPTEQADQSDPSDESNDQLTLTIADVTVTEGNTGKTDATFNVSLSAASSQPVTVSYAIVRGTATEADDYSVRVRDFIICRFDPFVGLFRMMGTGSMLMLGGGFLLVGLFIGRPYCRFFCPYGALLGIFSRFAWRGVTITPDTELDCGLCSRACPFGAIEKMRPVQSSCLSCARCYQSCPRERVRNGEIGVTEIEVPTTESNE